MPDTHPEVYPAPDGYVVVREDDWTHLLERVAHLDALTAAAKLVDEGWHVVEGDEGRDRVRLRYASDLPARLNTLREALEPHDA